MHLASNYLSATETITLVASGQLSVTQVAIDHLGRYSERDESIQAWAYIDRDRIMKEAARLDAIPHAERGLMHGVILGVKDMIGAFKCWYAPGRADHESRYKRYEM